jgi:hypothetical protein
VIYFRLLETLQNLVTIFIKRPAQDFLDPLVSSASRPFIIRSKVLDHLNLLGQLSPPLSPLPAPEGAVLLPAQ